MYLFLLFYSIATIGLALAGLAMLACPHGIKMVGGGIDQSEIVSQYPALEVALAIGLHTDTRTRKVCRANICHLAIENHHLEVDSRTEFTLQILYESRIFVEIRTKVRTWLFGV